jgi:signal transduction histidine kinase
VKSGLRSSLFWTFAGSFLLVLVLAAVLQGLVTVAVIEPLGRSWARDRAELLVRRAASELAATAGADDDAVALGQLGSFRHEAHSQSLLLVLRRPDGRMLFDRTLPPWARARVTRVIDGQMAPGTPRLDPTEPPPGEPPFGMLPERPGDWRRRGGFGAGRRLHPPLHAIYRHPISAELGEMIAIQEGRPMGLPPAPGGSLLLFLPLAVAVAGTAGLILFRAQVKRLRALEALAERVAEGDLEARVVDAGRDEMGRLGAGLNRMTEALAAARGREQQDERRRRQLLADISHELATPLTSIRGYAETLLNREVVVSAEEQTAYLRHILQESERLDLLTRDLFELARFEAGATPLQRVDLDWGELCRHTVERFQPRFEANRLALEWRGAATATPISADGHRMEQVLENLLANALRYVPAGGRVTVSLESAGDRWRLSVEDNGPGIPPHDLPHVFERFYRADQVRALPGSGLGLAIVREIVERHGGRVDAQARAPRGLVVSVELPARA